MIRWIIIDAMTCESVASDSRWCCAVATRCVLVSGVFRMESTVANNALEKDNTVTGYGPGYVDDKGLGYGWAEWRDNCRDDPGQPEHRGTPVSM